MNNLKQKILELIPSLESTSVTPTGPIDQKILFYPQNLPLFKHDYVKNWSNLIDFNSFKQQLEHISVPTDDSKVPVGKNLIIVAGHQHSFRELLFPFQEISGNYLTNEFRVGLRNGTCVMVGLFSGVPPENNDLSNYDDAIKTNVDGVSYYLDMRVVFTEIYVPNRDKDKYIYLNNGDSLLYRKLDGKYCFRNNLLSKERDTLIKYLSSKLDEI